MAWKSFPDYWHFITGTTVQQWNSLTKNQYCRALMFLCRYRTSYQTNSQVTGSLRYHGAHWSSLLCMKRQSCIYSWNAKVTMELCDLSDLFVFSGISCYLETWEIQLEISKIEFLISFMQFLISIIQLPLHICIIYDIRYSNYWFH